MVDLAWCFEAMPGQRRTGRKRVACRAVCRLWSAAARAHTLSPFMKSSGRSCSRLSRAHGSSWRTVSCGRVGGEQRSGVGLTVGGCSGVYAWVDTASTRASRTGCQESLCSVANAPIGRLAPARFQCCCCRTPRRWRARPLHSSSCCQTAALNHPWWNGVCMCVDAPFAQAVVAHAAATCRPRSRSWNACIPRFSPKLKAKLHGCTMVMS